MVIRGTGGGATGAEQLDRNNYFHTSVSQSFAIRREPSYMNQNNPNFSIIPASMYNYHHNNMTANGDVIRENLEIIRQPEIYRKVWSSQHSVEDIRRSETEERSQNFEVTSLRACLANRLDFENIRSIQNTDLFREAFGLLSDYWIFKVFQNNIFSNNKV